MDFEELMRCYDYTTSNTRTKGVAVLENHENMQSAAIQECNNLTNHNNTYRVT